PKTYEAALCFGSVTDTQDSTGTVIERRLAGHLTRAAVEVAAERFRGVIEQVPPMYSAIKVGGRPLYERARQGEVIERAARRVEIYDLEITRFEPGPEPGAGLRVTCSSGTYVRTLCHDLGQRLGTGAVMTALTRTAIGPFTLDGAMSLDG